jgi:hypothetical protein
MDGVKYGRVCLFCELFNWQRVSATLILSQNSGHLPSSSDSSDRCGNPAPGHRLRVISAAVPGA